MRKKNIDLSTFEGRIKKQGYHQVGAHSAAKICKYSKDSILGKEGCYKHKFYGIASHQCLQCSPVLQFCNLSCRFCWRIMPETKSGWLKMPPKFQWDEPEFVAEGLIKEQKRIMSGFKGNPNADQKKAIEAMQPKHVALSLIGEPTLYPKLSELIEEFHKRKMTTFLVTNGTNFNALKNLKTLPTQLYISLIAPDLKTYQYVANVSQTQAKIFWSNYLKSLKLLNKLSSKTRTVLRMTLAHNLNDFNLEGYTKLINLARPHFVEVKSMVYVGWARNAQRGLQLSDMLSMQEIRKFAKSLAALTNYLYTAEHKLSRVALLCRDKEAQKNRIINLNSQKN
ncbi:MAG: 4-demethylwyosine synthase TYW1 [Candidatus Micrarchaeota archaeon]|nr:4-demethylwyosine synthase TYW1 [Candidatus Micrarchaeota archaeon]